MELRCPQCEYELDGLAAGPSAVCPECGSPLGEEAARVADFRAHRRFMRAARSTLLAPAVLVLGAEMYADATRDRGSLVYYSIIAAAWGGAMLLALSVVRHAGRHRFRRVEGSDQVWAAMLIATCVVMSELVVLSLLFWMLWP